MKFKRIHIRNYRSCKDLRFEVEPMQALVGANNAGKSSIIRALDFLFNPSTTKVDKETFWNGDIERTIRVEALFDELTDIEKNNDQLKGYLRPDETFHIARSAIWKIEEPEEEGAPADEGKPAISQHFSKPSPIYDWLQEGKINGNNISVRDLVNQYKKNKDPNYCVRVTANDGEIGEQFLREFQDNEKTIPTVLTTSQKLSTGINARNIHNIVLMRPVNQIIEFKQIVGRGTRLFEGKEFFTIYDFVDAYQRFSDPEWDGEPVEEVACPDCGEVPCVCEKIPPKPCKVCGQRPCICEKEPPQPCDKCGQRPCICIKKVKIKLRDGKEREIQHMIATSFWSADGKPISAEEFLDNLFCELPNFFKSEDELRILWSNPMTRKTLLEKLDEAGFGREELNTLQKLIDAEKSDLFDVLEYVFNSDIKPITREERATRAEATIFALLNDKQKEFIEFVLSKYIETGFEELDQDKLPILLTNKYQSLEDAKEILGDVANISSLFIEFQKHLYLQRAA